MEYKLFPEAAMTEYNKHTFLFNYPQLFEVRLVPKK